MVSVPEPLSNVSGLPSCGGGELRLYYYFVDGVFDVTVQATHAAAGDWRVTVRDVFGNSCCVTDWITAPGAQPPPKPTWG